MKRYSLRRMLIFVTLIAIGIAIYCSTKKDTPRAKIAAMSHFSPNVHSVWVEQLDPAVFVPVDKPVLPIKKPLAEMEHRDWEPARSDWFLVEEGDAKNFVHIATSAEGKFVVNVWANNKIMLHENQVSAIENSPEELLSYKLVSELSLAFRGIKELKTLLKDDQ